MTSPPATSSAEGPSLGGSALTPRTGETGLLIAVLIVECLATLVDIGRGPWSVVGFEEGRNARAALQLACGHSDRLLDLQYRDFCGGCTGVALVGAPLFRALGATVAVWKLVPALFHVGLVAAVAALVRRCVHTRAAVLSVAVLSAAPPALRELSLTGWGNHAEVRVLVLLAAGLLLTQRRPWLGASIAGAVAGLSVWFAHIALFAIPGLLYLGIRRGRSALAFLLGLPLGLLPAWLYVQSRPTALAGSQQMWGQLHLSPPGDWLAYLLGPLRPGSLWPPSDIPGLQWLLAASMAVAVVAAGWATVRDALRRSPLAIFVVLAALGFATATLLRADLWSDVPSDPGFSAFHLRYRAVLWPLVPLGLALLARTRTRLAVAAALPLIVFGLGARAMAWTTGPGPTLFAPVWNTPGRPDATVPEGAPPRRNPWSLDRPQDIAAAMDFLTQTTEPLAACAVDHEGELGRRIGLHVRRGGTPSAHDLPPVTAVLAAGAAWGLYSPAGRHPERVPGALPPSWEAAVASALGRLARDGTDTMGTCLGLAEQAWDQGSNSGRIRVTTPPPAPPSECPDPDQWSQALRTVSSERGRCPLAPDWPSCEAQSQSP